MKTLMFIALTLASFAGQTFAQQPNQQRPNILFIMSDDHAAHSISAYGSKVNTTAAPPKATALATSRFTIRACPKWTPSKFPNATMAGLLRFASRQEIGGFMPAPALFSGTEDARR